MRRQIRRQNTLKHLVHTCVTIVMTLFTLLGLVGILLILLATQVQVAPHQDTDLLRPNPLEYAITGPHWFYQLHFEPVDPSDGQARCSLTINLQWQTSCSTPVFAEVALVQKEGQNSLVWSVWRGSIEASPIEAQVGTKYLILQSRYFLVSADQLQVGAGVLPQIHDLLDDASTALRHWLH